MWLLTERTNDRDLFFGPFATYHAASAYRVKRRGQSHEVTIEPLIEIEPEELEADIAHAVRQQYAGAARQEQLQDTWRDRLAHTPLPATPAGKYGANQVKGSPDAYRG